MKASAIWWIIGGGVLLAMAATTYQSILRQFLPSWEGFSERPYWDVSRYSWGYGTPAPDPAQTPGATITRGQAMDALLKHVESDRIYLQGLLRRNLTPRQWAALLSFSYNLGPGNADNLIPNINSGNTAALAAQWAKYVDVNGMPSTDLVQRRAAEWQLYSQG